MNKELIIEMINKKIDAKEEEISKAKKEVIELEKELLEKRTELKEGDIVSNEEGIKGILCFNPEWTTSWSWKKLKKDGSESKNICMVYGKIKKVE